MRQTPLQKAIEQIHIQAEDYRKRGNGDKSEALLDSINLLQSLLPYERECFVETYKKAVEDSDNYGDVPKSKAPDAERYFNQTFKQNNPQGGGGK